MERRLNNELPSEINTFNIKMDFEDQLKKINLLAKNICSCCGGSGKIRAMQSMAVFGGKPVRGLDTKVKCNNCNGKGVKGNG